jgi:hypothetical protein
LPQKGKFLLNGILVLNYLEYDLLCFVSHLRWMGVVLIILFENFFCMHNSLSCTLQLITIHIFLIQMVLHKPMLIRYFLSYMFFFFFEDIICNVLLTFLHKPLFSFFQNLHPKIYKFITLGFLKFTGLPLYFI